MGRKGGHRHSGQAFFRRRPALRASLPLECYSCGVEVARGTLDNAVWVGGKHVGYVCSADECSRYMAGPKG